MFVMSDRRDIYRRLPQQGVASGWGAVAARYLTLTELAGVSHWSDPWSPSWGSDDDVEAGGGGGGDGSGEDIQREFVNDAGAMVVSVTYYDGATIEQIPRLAEEFGQSE